MWGVVPSTFQIHFCLSFILLSTPEGGTGLGTCASSSVFQSSILCHLPNGDLRHMYHGHSLLGLEACDRIKERKRWVALDEIWTAQTCLVIELCKSEPDGGKFWRIQDHGHESKYSLMYCTSMNNREDNRPEPCGTPVFIGWWAEQWLSPPPLPHHQWGAYARSHIASLTRCLQLSATAETEQPDRN